MSRRPNVVVTPLPPVRLDAVIWPNIKQTAAALRSAIDAIAGANALLAVLSSTRPRSIVAQNGIVLANVYGDGAGRGHIVHSWTPSIDLDPDALIRVGLDCQSGQKRYVLEIVCQRSYAPLPVATEQMGDHDQVAYILDFFHNAMRVSVDDPDIVHDAIPEVLRLASLGAAFEESALALPAEGLPSGFPVRSTGRTALGNERLEIGASDSDMIVGQGRIMGLPSILRMDAISDPDGPVLLSARLSAQRIITDLGGTGPVDRMRAIAAWHDQLRRNAAAESEWRNEMRRQNLLGDDV